MSIRPVLHPRMMARAMSFRWRSLLHGRAPGLVVFVSGVPRSGTNMILDLLAQSPEAEVFGESDPRIYDNYEIRRPDIFDSYVARCPRRVAVFKLLLDADRLGAYLDRFPDARGIWIYRAVEDTVNSNMAKWPDGRNQLDAIVADRRAGGWRGRSISERTMAVLRAHYRPEINNATAQALFWYHRHMLYFDQGLAEDRRVVLIKYDDLVSDAPAHLRWLADELGLVLPEHAARKIFSSSVGRAAPPDIDPAVLTLCHELAARMDAIWRHQRHAEASAPPAAARAISA